MKIVDTRLEHADSVVVRGPASASVGDYMESRLVVFTGGRVAQLEYIVTARAKGTCLEYKPAVSNAPRRQMWVSAAWAERNPQLLEILQDSIAHPTSVWAWFASNNIEFVRRAGRVKNIVGLVTTAEFYEFPAGLCNVYTSALFLGVLSKAGPNSQLFSMAVT